MISNFLEIEITSDCNLKCIDCDRQCRQAPTTEQMDLNQVYYFLDEMNETGYRFNNITLLGGEPLIHPELYEILSAFAERGIRPAIVSNGYGDFVKSRVEELRRMRYSVNDTNKTSRKHRYFERMNIAPKDHGLEAKPCWILQSCGYALTRYGFYPCGAGAAIDRVMGFDIGIKSLQDIKGAYQFTSQLCQYCGHSEAAQKIPKATRITPSWVRALRKYHQSPPTLSLYGHKGVHS